MLLVQHFCRVSPSRLFSCQIQHHLIRELTVPAILVVPFFILRTVTDGSGAGRPRVNASVESFRYKFESGIETLQLTMLSTATVTTSLCLAWLRSA